MQNSIFFEDDGKTLRPFEAAVSPYALLGLEPHALVDSALVKKAYLQASRSVHPDRFQRQGGEAKERARAWSSALNDAKSLLASPRRVLEWLFKEEGLATDAETIQPPQALLMQVFEINEALDDVEGRAPSESEAKGLESQKSEILSDLESQRGHLQEACKAWDEGQQDAAHSAWKEVVASERYLRRILERIEAAMGMTESKE